MGTGPNATVPSPAQCVRRRLGFLNVLVRRYVCKECDRTAEKAGKCPAGHGELTTASPLQLLTEQYADYVIEKYAAIVNVPFEGAGPNEKENTPLKYSIASLAYLLQNENLHPSFLLQLKNGPCVQLTYDIEANSLPPSARWKDACHNVNILKHNDTVICEHCEGTGNKEKDQEIQKPCIDAKLKCGACLGTGIPIPLPQLCHRICPDCFGTGGLVFTCGTCGGCGVRYHPLQFEDMPNNTTTIRDLLYGEEPNTEECKYQTRTTGEYLFKGHTCQTHWPQLYQSVTDNEWSGGPVVDKSIKSHNIFKNLPKWLTTPETPFASLTMIGHMTGLRALFLTDDDVEKGNLCELLSKSIIPTDSKEYPDGEPWVNSETHGSVKPAGASSAPAGASSAAASI